MLPTKRVVYEPDEYSRPRKDMVTVTIDTDAVRLTSAVRQ